MYKQKYLKYKNKYINLKHIGGVKKIYVKYPDGEWFEFIKNGSNDHQLDMLNEFIEMDIEEHTFKNYPHILGGVLTVSFHKINENKYYYVTETGMRINFFVSEDGRIPNNIQFENIGYHKTPINNEHILDFTKGHINKLPEWFKDRQHLKLATSCGDWVTQGMTNIEKYNMYDVFSYYPLYPGGSNTRSIYPNEDTKIANLQYLIDYFYHEKIICLYDKDNLEQMINFCDLFPEKFNEIFDVDKRVRLDALTTYEILEVGGKCLFDKDYKPSSGFSCSNTNGKELKCEFSYDPRVSLKCCIKIK